MNEGGFLKKNFLRLAARHRAMRPRARRDCPGPVGYRQDRHLLHLDPPTDRHQEGVLPGTGPGSHQVHFNQINTRRTIRDDSNPIEKICDC